jgi:hypothetical protein
MLLGTVPHRSASQALAAVRRYTGELVAWPQLPQRSFREHSLVQAALGFPGLVIDATKQQIYVDRAVAERELDRLELAYLTSAATGAALADDYAAGLSELVRQRDTLRGILLLKGQLVGPISLAAQLTDERQRPLIYDRALFDALVHHLHLRAAWQSSQLAELCPTTMICIDEPFLDAVGLPFLPIDWPTALAQIDEVLSGVGGCRALLVGGSADWSRLFQTSADLVIADVYAHTGGLAAAAEDVAAFLRRDGLLGLGLIPVDEEALRRETPESLVRRLAGMLTTLEQRGVAPELLLRRSIITPSDMIGRLSVEAAEGAMQLLMQTSRLLRERYGIQ